MLTAKETNLFALELAEQAMAMARQGGLTEREPVCAWREPVAGVGCLAVEQNDLYRQGLELRVIFNSPRLCSIKLTPYLDELSLTGLLL